MIYLRTSGGMDNNQERTFTKIDTFTRRLLYIKMDSCIFSYCRFLFFFYVWKKPYCVRNIFLSLSIYLSSNIITRSPLARSPRRSTVDKSGLCNWILCLFVCLFVCLSVCLLVLCKFSNFFLQYKAAAVRAVISIR